MKILHVITSLRTGGAEKLMADLLPRFNANGTQADLLLFNGADTHFKQQLQKAGVRIYELGRGSVYNPLHIFRLLPYLRRYDIIHTHNTAPQLFVAIASLLCSTILVTTEHNTTNRRRDWWWYKPIDNWMYNRYRQVVCISDKTEENLRRYMGDLRAQISTIYNGVDVGLYHAAELSDDVKTLCAGSRVVVMVAGFRYQKDQDTLIKALSLLPKEYRLVFVGDGERRGVCEKLCQSLGVTDRCHFLGIRTDVSSILKAAFVVVQSSHIDGFCLAVVEGMSAHKPVIASDVPGLSQVVSGAGVLFPHEDYKDLANAIMRLGFDKAYYQSVADACYARAKEFDISVMADNYLKMYRNIWIRR